MSKKIAGLVSVVAGVATMGAAHAATAPAVNPAEALQASSYADLLSPVQNATAVMKADDAARARQPRPEGEVELAQAYYYGYGPPPAYHHHHHHHHHHQAYYRHHHHHHHHHSDYIGVPGVGVVIGRP
jgi:hypothetical protein